MANERDEKNDKDIQKDHYNDYDSDVNKLHKKKEQTKDKVKDAFVDNFNFWINVAFLILGTLLILTILLLFYSLFYNNTQSYTISSKASESIRMPTINETITTPIINKTITESVNPSPIISETKPKSSLFSSLFSSKKVENVPTPPIKPKSTSFFGSIFSSKNQTPIITNNITENVDILNKDTSIGFTKQAPSTTTNNSMLSTIVSPLYNRKVELPQMKHTGGSYNKLLKRF
jgi:hypothetical protein